MKTKNINRMIIKATLCLAFVGALSSCSRYYYKPNPVNAPMLKEQHDLKIGISGNFDTEEFDDNESNGRVVNFSAAYSPVKYVGVMSNFTNFVYDLKTEDLEKGDVDARATLFEGGVGGYYPVFEGNHDLKLIFDTYVGYGGGKLKSDVNMNFNKIFIQPGFSMTLPFVDAGLALRFSGIKYSNFDNNGMPQEYIESRGLTNITDKRHFFFEPAITVRGGYKFIKAQLQLVKSGAFDNQPWNYDSTMGTFGIFFSLEELFKMK